VIVDLIGKGRRVRSVPMPQWTRQAIEVWLAMAGIESGFVFRQLDKSGRVAADRLTAKRIFQIVSSAGARIGVPTLAPHDLRRTFARLAHQGRSSLEQIQLSLGHASVMTTERYLGVRQDLTDAPCDHLGIAIEVSR
jgi:integrase